MSIARRPARDDSGQVVVLFALLLTVLLGFLALGVDLGQGYEQRRQTQNAADSGSVAAMRALLKQSNDSDIQNAIRHVLDNSGYSDGNLVFLSPTNPTAGTTTGLVYVDAEYGTYNTPTLGKCTPLSSNQWVGSNGNNLPPSSANCVKVKVSTDAKTFFGKVLGESQIGASAQSSAAQISIAVAAADAGANPTATPTPAPWYFDSEGFSIWGGRRADSRTLTVGSPVLFFADSGWDTGNDYDTSAGTYDATQNFKGIADPQCFTLPPQSSCTGPNGSHGNEALSIPDGTFLQIGVVDNVTHSGSTNILNEIGLITVQKLSSCPSSPSYLQTGTNGVCGTIVHIDWGSLNDSPAAPANAATPTPTPIGVGNVGS